MGNNPSIISDCNVRAIDPMIDIDIKNGKETVQRIMAITFSRDKVFVFYRYGESNKLVGFDFKKGSNENDVWEYVEDYITKLIKENEEIMILNNFRNRGFAYCFNKETQGTVGTYIKLLVRCILKCDRLYMTG